MLSLPIIRYCQKLPGDQYTIMSPDFKLEPKDDAICELDGRRYETLFLCTVYLPTCSPVRSAQVKRERGEERGREREGENYTFNFFIQNITQSTPISYFTSYRHYNFIIVGCSSASC